VIRFFRGLDGYEADMAAGLWQHRRNPGAWTSRGRDGPGPHGRARGARADGVRFPVNGWSRTPHAIDGVRLQRPQDFDAFLRATRILVNLLPLTPETDSIIDARSWPCCSRAPMSSTWRGGHVADEDLVAAIDGGHVSGAMLDVFRTEPLPDGHAFWRHPRITLTPHTRRAPWRAKRGADRGQGRGAEPGRGRERPRTCGAPLLTGALCPASRRCCAPAHPGAGVALDQGTEFGRRAAHGRGAYGLQRVRKAGS
jgi:glyoxylate/hydroxypyruvate reductase A